MELKGVIKVEREVKKGKQLVLKDQVVLTRLGLQEAIALIEQEKKKQRGKRKYK